MSRSRPVAVVDRSIRSAPVRDCPGERSRTRRIDLNADLGEGFGGWVLGDDDALLDVVTSANVACGFHAGDPATLRPDLRAGGRPAASPSAPRSPTATWPASAAGSSTSSRPSWPTTCSTSSARSTGSPAPPAAGCRYVKPHGALYNAAVTPRGAGRRGRRRRPAYDPGCRARAARLGAAARRRGGRDAPGRRGVRRPRLHGRRHAWCPAASRARWCTTRPRSPRARCGW